MDDDQPSATIRSSSGTITVVPNGETVPGGGAMTRDIADKFFVLKNDNLLKAFEDVKRQLNPEIDGELLGRWILTEISYWNRDKEKLVLLCSNNMLVCKYDFVAMKLGMVTRVNLSQAKNVQKGKFVYPENSVLTPRLYEGVRFSWGTMEEKKWWEKWNPLNNDIPFITFTSHPLMAMGGLDSPEFYDVATFYSALKDPLSDKQVSFEDDTPILIETYAGVASLISNQSRLGFSRERGGISF